MKVASNELINQFLQIVLYEVEFFNVPPSQLAAAIVVSTRKLLQIDHYWTNTFAVILRYEIEEIRHLIILLMEKESNSFQKQAKILI